MAKNTLNEIVSLSKRRGFIFQSSEIYGGINACWDMGPLGVELKNNIKRLWWKEMVQRRDNVEGLDASILMHPRVWEASGHISHFSDPMVECKQCHHRFRADTLKKNRCPDCGGELTEPRMFNLMFKTHIGPVENDSSVVYLRPETAQGIYVNFQSVMTTSRQKIPFGIAQIGKAFRNEISPGNFIFRSREFEQMEMQFFIHPDEQEKWFEYWKKERMHWYRDRLGIAPEHLHFRDHEQNELAHYARAAVDIEFDFPFGTKELEGVHNRGNYDLTQHEKFSGKKQDYFDQKRNEHYIPFIIETSGGVDRALLAVLCDAFTEEPEPSGKGGMRRVMKIHPRLAPVKVGVFPLVNRDGMDDIARDIAHNLRSHFNVFYDDGGSIGRRYRRQDEAGTPFCVTVDSETLTDGTVTIRERDTLVQVRVKIDDIPDMVRHYIDSYKRDKGL